METFQNLFNALARPEPYMGLVTLGFILLLWKVRFITRPPVMAAIALLTALFFVVAARNHDFKLIISKGRCSDCGGGITNL